MPAPANWASITVTGQYIYPDGTYAAGTVTFTNTVYLRDMDLNYVVVPKPVQATLDGTGSFSVTLQATDDPDIDPTFYYTVTEVIGGITTAFPLLVPKDTLGATLNLADVDRNATIPAAPDVYVRTINGMWGDIDTGSFTLTPASTIQSEVAYGITAAVGTSANYAREDHTHGSPTTPAIPVASSTNPTAVTIAGAVAIGAGTTWARADHAHAGPGFGNVTAETTAGLSAANGSAITVARSDHAHGNPGSDSSVQQSIYMNNGSTVGTRKSLNFIPGTNVTFTMADDSVNNRVNLTVNSTGSGGSLAVQKAGTLVGTRGIINFIDGTNVTTTVADNAGATRVDVTIAATGGGVALTAVTPTAEAIASTAVVGTGTAAAREDHRHAMPAAGAPVASAVGDTVVTGAVGTFADSGHKHAREAFGTPGSLAFGGAVAAGTAVTVAHSDHAHGMPATPTAALVGAIPNANGVGYVGAGTLASRPAAGTAGRLYYVTDLNSMFEDNGTTWTLLDQSPAIANSWTAVGHSYLQFNAASYNQRSRLDSILRSRMDAESTNWANLAIAGSRATVEGAAQGGWATFARSINKLAGKTAPYTSSDGGLLLCTGINDLGTLGGATAQMQLAYGHAMRYMISRWRASTIFEDTDSHIAFGGTWTQETTKPDQASSSNWRYTATTSVSAVTFTLPADYDGGPVVMQFVGRPGVNGGVVTFSGTAGVTGTLSTDNIMPSASLSNVPVIKRVTTLTSANAGQTIIATVTSNNGLIYFDCAWLEAVEAPPVVMCNVARLTAAGYSTKYSSWNAAPALASCDADVAAFNTVLTNLKAEFDGMVQIADIDTVMNKVASLYVDGLHPNERGAALIADEIDNARRRMQLTGVKSASMNMNMGPRYSGGMRLRRRSGYYHTADFGAVTTYTPVVGDMFALPFEVTEMDEQYARWAMALNAAATSGTCTIRWGMYSDFMNKGYPDINLQELTVGTGALSISTAAGPQLNPSAQYTWWPDIANYYLVMKIETIGVGFVFAGLQGPSYSMPAAGSSGDVRVASNGAAVAWKLTGQATGALPSTFPSGAIPANVAPYMGALKS